jgi:hypothetical protein
VIFRDLGKIAVLGPIRRKPPTLEAAISGRQDLLGAIHRGWKCVQNRICKSPISYSCIFGDLNLLKDFMYRKIVLEMYGSEVGVSDTAGVPR